MKYSNYVSKQIKKSIILSVLGITALLLTITLLLFNLNTSHYINKDHQQITKYIEEDINLLNNSLSEVYDLSDDEQNKKHLIQLLYNTRKNAHIKFNFTVFDKNNNIIATNLFENNQQLIMDRFDDGKISHRIEISDDFKIIEGGYNLYDTPQKSIATIIYQGEHVNYVIEPLYNSITTIARNLNTDLILCDQFDNVLYDSSDRYSDELSKLTLDKKSNTTTLTDIEGIRVYSTQSRMFPRLMILYVLIIIVIVSIALFLLIQPLSEKLVSTLDQPLNELLIAIEANARGNFDFFIESNTFEEFASIHKQFNILVKNTQELMEKNKELAETKKAIEVKQLKSQFNPHFIYNTLESIRYEIMFHPKTASDMVLSLGRLMQYSVESANSLIPIKIDIKFIEDYLKLQKMRFKNRLVYVIDVDELAKDCLIPKLLIQPIIENSIKHNMDRVNQLNLIIKIFIKEDELHIVVRDDGVGIEKEKLHQIIKNIVDKKHSDTHLGLFNTERVIKLMYGDAYGIELESKQGLMVSIILPIN